MPRQKFNLDRKIVGRKCKVRKRCCSSTSSSSLVQNYRLKRALLVGRRVGSSIPVPTLKMMSSKSPSMEKDETLLFKKHAAKGGEKGKDSSTSARKLAATLWEINGLPSPRVKEDGKMSSEVALFGKENILGSSKLGSMALGLSDLFYSPVPERMDPSQLVSHRRRTSVGSQKLLEADCDFRWNKSLHNCLLEVDQKESYARCSLRHSVGSNKHLKAAYNDLVTSKELLKVMSRVCGINQHNAPALFVFSALKFELDRVCIHVTKLLQDRTNRSEIEHELGQLEEQDRIRSAIASVAGDLETEKKLRRQTERINTKLGHELAETKASLSKITKELESEKRAREILEQMCDELARGIGEGREEVEELKRQSEKVRKEVDKEREMLQLADILREERVQMKLSEAKYEFEEKNAVVDKLRNELEAYLKSNRGEKRHNYSPSYDKIMELEKYLRETLPGPYQYEDAVKGEIAGNKDEDDANNDDEEDDSDLHCFELNVEDISKSFHGRKQIKPSVSSGRRSIEWEFFTKDKQDHHVVDLYGKKDMEEELERYNMIKDLREHIVAGSRMGQPAQDPSGGVACHG